MANMKIKSAVSNNNQFDLSGQHITTSDFGISQVSNIIEVVPRDSVRMNLFCEARLAPMPVPTYMDVKLVTRAFFVPMTSIYRHFEDFMRQSRDTSISSLESVPTFTNKAMYNYLKGFTYAIAPNDVEGLRSVRCDFYDTDGAGYLFNDQGRWLYKLLLSLGYSINFTESDLTSMSLLPLLAYMRVCYDYLYPSQYVDSLGIAALFEQRGGFSDTELTTSTELAVILNPLMQMRHLPFKQDYFTAAWKDLNKPGYSNGGVTSESSSINVDGTTIQSLDNKVYAYDQNGSNLDLSSLSQRAVDFLRRFYQYSMRNNIAGSRFVDRVMAHFGVGSHEISKDSSSFLNAHVQDVLVQDVTASTATENQFLGELAGKANSQNGDSNFLNFSVPKNMYGYVILISHVEPRINYFQGRKVHTLHKSLFDFYTAEFDMSMRAIRNDELYADFHDERNYSGSQLYGGKPNGVFGFAPNYSEYKKGDSYLTGDFRLPSLNVGLESYHLFRTLSEPSVSHPLSLSSDFLMTRPHEFDRIFAQPMVSRIPVSWLSDTSLPSAQGFAGKRLYLAFNGKVILFKNTTSNKFYTISTHRGYEDSTAVQVVNEASFSGSISDYYLVSDSSDIFSFYDTRIVIGGSGLVRDYTIVPPSYAIDQTQQYESGTTPILTANIFSSWFSAYLDHFYIRYIFNIQASRPMKRISDEFMINEGGDEVNIAMNGNQIN